MKSDKKEKKTMSSIKLHLKNIKGAKIRIDILNKALTIEAFTSLFLAEILGIHDPEKSNSFGMSGSALSFDAKINLLIDVGALNKEERNKFRIFMEIRNKFIHNININTYENCFATIEGRDKYIMSLYKPVQTISREDHLQMGVHNLFIDVMEKTLAVAEKIIEKETKERLLKINTDLVLEVGKQYSTVMSELVEYLDFKGNNYTYKRAEVLEIVDTQIKALFATVKQQVLKNYGIAPKQKKKTISHKKKPNLADLSSDGKPINNSE